MPQQTQYCIKCSQTCQNYTKLRDHVSLVHIPSTDPDYDSGNRPAAIDFIVGLSIIGRTPEGRLDAIDILNKLDDDEDDED